MQTKVTWNDGSQTIDLPDSEFGFFKGVSDVLTTLPPPNQATVVCPYGTAIYDIIRKGGTAFIREESNNITLPGSRTYPEVYLTCVNPQWNNYKYYHLKQVGDNVIATYGRIGAEKGEMYGERTYTYPKRMFWVKYQEKLAKGYVDQSKIYLASRQADATGTPSRKANPSAEQDTTADALYRLLKSFARKHVEAVCVNSRITQGMVDAARKYLDVLYTRKRLDSFNNTLLDLLSVCPRRVRNVADLLAKSKDDFGGIIGREESLIAAMEALVSSPVKDDGKFKEGFQDVEIFIATDKQKEQVMERLSPQLHGHVKQVYRVIPKQQQARFDAYLKKNGIKKVMQLWHGSRNENWLSIIQNSLKLRPDAVITGKMFGDGIYFAPSSMKSWNYTSFHGTTWAKGRSDKAFMSLYATAYGEPLDVYTAQRFSQSSLGGKSCVHAHAGNALRNDEIIFYSEDAVVLNYIVEFGR